MAIPINRKWRCSASVYCEPICSRNHVDKESCPFFYVKPKKGEFTEEFVPYERKSNKKLRKQKNGYDR